MTRAFAAAALVCAIALPTTVSAQDDYLDNRSDAAALVRSLYNAVNRKEYARAWDYYGDEKPAGTYDKFVQGYADTQRVDVATGAISAEGAAGSTFYQVPVAIRATDTKGNEKVFAGCYTARLANPQIQEPPFRPMHIEKGSLKPIDTGGPLTDALPQSCGDAPPTKADARETIINAFKATYGTICQTLEPGAEAGAADPEITALKFRYHDSEEERAATLYKFNCIYSAYNTGEVYYLENDYGDFRQLQFAEPELDIRYDDPGEETKLKSMTIIGYRTTDQLVNSFFDDKEMSLTSFNKWRGIGDTSSTGKWIFRNGEFTLVHYDVDPTSDEEINPETVLNFEEAP